MARYALGNLPLGPSLTVSLHVEICPTCQASVKRIEEAEGRTLASMPDTPLQPRSLELTLARLDAEEGPQGANLPTISQDIVLPAALDRIGLARPVHLTPEAWVAHLNAPRIGGWRTYLFCGPPKATLPEHGHQGDELIFVLEGAFDDGRGFGEGDLVENKMGFNHTMEVRPEGRLVALVSSSGPIAWRPQDASIGELLDI